MSRNIWIAVLIAAMIVLIVGLDFLFLRNQFWTRLIVNIGIVLVFGAGYFIFLRPR